MQKLTILYPQGRAIELLPVTRLKLKEIRAPLVELQSWWLQNVFSLADTVADEHCWELIKTIAAMLPNADNPAVTGFDLELLSNDYGQLESLFFCQGKVYDESGSFDLDKFQGGSLVELHYFNPKLLIQEADQMRSDRAFAALKVAVGVTPETVEATPSASETVSEVVPV